MEHWQILSFILEKINWVLYVYIVMSHLTYFAKQPKNTEYWLQIKNKSQRIIESSTHAPVLMMFI